MRQKWLKSRYGMPPATRRRFVALCRRVAEIALPREKPKAGVLAALRDGGRYA